MQTLKLESGQTLATNGVQPLDRTKPNSKLRQSIRDTNGNEMMPAIVHNGELIDGHRRYEACLLENVPFYYIETDTIVPASFIQTLNTTSKQWTTKNYLSSHSRILESYDKLLDYINTNKIPVSLINSFCGYSEPMLKAGVSIDINYKKLNFKLKIYNYVRGLYPEAQTNLIHRSIAKMYKHVEFDEKEFWKNLSKIDTIEQLESKQHWLVYELSKIYGNLKIYEDIKFESYSKRYS